ncbi:septal ring factor EnvC (AmiA/AmiB activator) [Frigoribacterium sp. PhB160]|uniref:aggregation-promoting factor C-terminal-like domain-containing protein n=1 Tax=Frigoribacterium sp. PhB160 TaxID=2485192 RepID=UPI000F94148B|nr:lytic transglycosylase domain-containing protein [Frigoribacterium sp. PhB160]ROS59686.1 septal ring factor EnvC (AmiA/AmiB activator) [Frigoribacterium sp. PhB160]
MSARRRPCRLRSAGLAVVATGASLALGAVLLVPATSAEAAGYPRWSDVEAAKGDAAATAAQVEAVTGALDSLEATAATRGDEAVAADALAAQAQDALDAADSRADQLAAEAAAAADDEQEAHRQAGQLAAHLSRAGSPQSMSVELFSSDDADELLYRLGSLTQLGDRWQGVLADATTASNTVSSLTDQAEAARTERDRLARAATDDAATAATAQAAADAQVAEVTTRSDELYAQLATLNATTADVERQYREGEAAQAAAVAQARAAQAAAAAAAARPAPSTGGGSVAAPAPAPAPAPATGGGPAPAPAPVPAPPVTAPAPPPVVVAPPSAVNDPAGAKAYAATKVGGGAEYTCLVQLWNKESGWRTSATNPYSGAYGIPQALLGSKMASAGADWRTSYRTQVDWGVGYIHDRYGTMCAAWAHSVENDWY